MYKCAKKSRVFLWFCLFIRHSYFIDTCTYGSQDSFTAIFINEMSYPIDVIWINNQQQEVVYKSDLASGEVYTQLTYFTHEWIFHQSGTNNRILAESNGVYYGTFEGCKFGAETNSQIQVALVAAGELSLIHI